MKREALPSGVDDGLLAKSLEVALLDSYLEVKRGTRILLVEFISASAEATLRNKSCGERCLVQVARLKVARNPWISFLMSCSQTALRGMNLVGPWDRVGFHTEASLAAPIWSGLQENGCKSRESLDPMRSFRQWPYEAEVTPC